MALCDGYWGWVWQAGLMAWLWVGQAFGVFLLPGFGASSSSPQVPGHLTSTCNAGIDNI